MLRNIRLKLGTFTLVVILSGMSLVTAALGTLTYQGVYKHIQAGFDQKLLAASTVTASFVDGSDHERIMKASGEDDPLYQEYVVPMQRIMREKDFTYIYTQIPEGGTKIVYGLDGTIGKDHSPLGSEDTAPEDEAEGIMKVYLTGNSYLSGIRAWQEWGLLKSAFVPIATSTGTITAMAGADVNISIIRQKTRFALLDVVGCGLVLLSIAGLTGARLVKRVTRPIGKLKSVALKVAAGRYGEQADIGSPTELRMLASTFNGLSSSLESRLRDLRQINESVENQRRERILFENLQSRDLFGDMPAAGNLQIEWLPDDHSSCTASGWVRWHYEVLFWSARHEDSPLAAARRRRDYGSVLLPLLHRLGKDWTALAAELEVLFTGTIDSFLLIDVESDRALCIHRRGPAPVLGGPAPRVVPRQPTGIEPGVAIAWTTRAAGEAHSLRLNWQAGAGHPLESLRRLLTKSGLLETDFSNMAPADLDIVLNAAHLEHRVPDERLSVQGELNDRLFVVLEGQARLEVPGAVVTLSVGQWIGEFSFLFGGVANVSVTVATPMHCLVWDRAPLAATLAEHPTAERSFLAMLAHHIDSKKIASRYSTQ